MITYVEGRVQSAITFDIVGGRIQAIYIIVNPEKLHAIPDLGGSQLGSPGP